MEAIEIFNKYFNQIPKDWNNVLFRGQANAAWFLDSGATRRLCTSEHAYRDKTYKNIPTEDFYTFVEYHTDLVSRAKGNKYHQREANEQNELELLASLQHFGAATCLIDFTRNFMVALWFACLGKEENGKVFCLDISSTDYYQSINQGDKFFSIENILRFETSSGQN